jgi:hypothetical protein
MRKTLYTILVILAPALLLAQSDHEPYFSKSLSSSAVNDVYARTSGGSITVAGVSSGEARIEVYVKSGNNSSLSKAEIKERLEDDYKLEVEVSDHKLTAVAEQKGSFNWRNSLSISFKIYVPKNVSTDLRTSGGSISLTNLTGTQNFATSGGGLSLDGLSGKIHGRTSGGSISVKNSNDDIDLSTSGGGITAIDCRGDIELSTSGGSINIESLDGTVNARTSGGSVRGSEVKGELIAHTSGGSVSLKDIAGSVDASTSGGNIDVEIKQLGKYVTVSNSGGNVRLTLPGDKGIDLKLRGGNINVDALRNFSGEQDEHKLYGKMNGGGIPVAVSTSGTITLSMR